MAVIELAHLLDQYLAARCLPPSFLECEGGLAFDAGGDVMLCASLSAEGGFELFANPGYLAAWESRAIIERRVQDDEDDGVLLCWEADEAVWSIAADLNTGLVALSRTHEEAPRDLESLGAALEAMLAIFAKWAARLQRTPPYLQERSLLSAAGFSHGKHMRV